MADNDQDHLDKMISSGWSIEGYSTAIMSSGMMSHSILLRKDNYLVQTTITTAGIKEIARSFTVLSPKLEDSKKRGWFG